LLVRIKIKHMELSIVRRETTGSGTSQYNESETITKFEIMDGAPVRGTYHSLLTTVYRLMRVCFWIGRRNDSDSLVFERIRINTHLSRCEQEILDKILSEFGFG
jgi:Vacuolar protein sorting-associated protein 26